MDELELRIFNEIANNKRPITTPVLAERLKMDKDLIHHTVVALRKAGKIQFLGKKYGWQARG